MRILLVEDDEALRFIVKDNLEQHLLPVAHLLRWKMRNDTFSVGPALFYVQRFFSTFLFRHFKKETTVYGQSYKRWDYSMKRVIVKLLNWYEVMDCEL